MFEELSRRWNDYQYALEAWATWRRHQDRERGRHYEKTPIGRRVRRAINARYRAQHRAEAVERTRQWRLANPDRSREMRREESRRRRERAKVDPAFAAKYRAIKARSEQKARERRAA